MATEQEWITELEEETRNRVSKRSLCQKLGIAWSEDFSKISPERLEQEIQVRTEIARKYGQKLSRLYLKKGIEEFEAYIINVAVRQKTIPERYSLTEVAKILSFPVSYLKALKINGLISYEEIGRNSYVNLSELKRELESPRVIEFFEGRKYSRAVIKLKS